MSKLIVEKDAQTGLPVVVVYHETPEEREERRKSRFAQAQRAREVAKSFRGTHVAVEPRGTVPR